MSRHRRRLSVLAACVAMAAATVSCAPANERPLRGAVPGSDAPTPPGVPPTLVPSDALRFRALPSPSPREGPAESPAAPAAASPAPAASPGPAASPAVAPAVAPAASPSVVAAPPIVRTIVPAANGHLSAGGAVTLSAVLVGRGADLASASLSLNGADTAAQIDRRTAREWAIHTSRPLGAGTYTVRVQVRDASGAAGGFTWQFVIGDEATPEAGP